MDFSAADGRGDGTGPDTVHLLNLVALQHNQRGEERRIQSHRDDSLRNPRLDWTGPDWTGLELRGWRGACACSDCIILRHATAVHARCGALAASPSDV